MKRITTVVLIVLILLVGCSKVEKSVKPQKGNTSRFVEVELTSMWKVVADKETGVMYAVSFGTHNLGTFTLLVDADGNPLIYKGVQE